MPCHNMMRFGGEYCEKLLSTLPLLLFCSVWNMRVRDEAHFTLGV